MQQMNERENTHALRSATWGHLGLTREGESYIVPLVYGYDGRHLYFQTTHGMKSDFIETTRRACFCIDWVHEQDEWTSVLVFGPIRKVEDDDERLVAMDSLMERPNPPAWGQTRTGEPSRENQPEEFYALDIEEVTGRKSAREPRILREAVELQGG